MGVTGKRRTSADAEPSADVPRGALSAVRRSVDAKGRQQPGPANLSLPGLRQAQSAGCGLPAGDGGAAAAGSGDEGRRYERAGDCRCVGSEPGYGEPLDVGKRVNPIKLAQILTRTPLGYGVRVYSYTLGFAVSGGGSYRPGIVAVLRPPPDTPSGEAGALFRTVAVSV